MAVGQVYDSRRLSIEQLGPILYQASDFRNVYADQAGRAAIGIDCGN